MSKLGRKSIDDHLEKNGHKTRIEAWVRVRQPEKQEIARMIEAATGIQFNIEHVRHWASSKGLKPKQTRLGIANVIQSMPIESRRIVFLGSLKDAVAEIERVAGASYSEASVTTWRVKRRKLIESCEN